MPRSRKSRSVLDKFLDDLISLPWWASAVVGGFCLVGWAMLMSGARGFPFQGAPGLLGKVIFFIFTGTAIGSVIHARRKRVALFKMKTLQDLQAVPWQEFEELAGAYYRERGCSVVRTGQAGPDGGFDLVLRKGGERVLVQCKKWSREAVSVEKVREFYGVVISEGAHRGIFITTSDFTAPAREFGLRHASLELIPGHRFAEMVSHIRRADAAASPAANTPADHSLAESQPPCCPRCAATMVSRKAGRGTNPGQLFWGCSRFPATLCKGTRPMEQPKTSAAAA